MTLLVNSPGGAAITPLTGAELCYLEQGGISKYTTASALAALASALPVYSGAMPQSMPNLKYVPVFGAALATGNNDLYTVPASRKALIAPISTAYNTSVGNISYYHAIKVSGTYYPISPSVTLATLTQALNTHETGIVLNAGESISVISSTTNGLNVRMMAYEFDATEARFLCARILALANGNNTLLTVPAAKSAVFPNWLAAAQAPGSIQLMNSSGISLNYSVNAVPSGGSVGSSNQLYPTTAIGNGAQLAFVAAPTLAAGDFLNINTSAGTAGQVAWCLYCLLP